MTLKLHSIIAAEFTQTPFTNILRHFIHLVYMAIDMSNKGRFEFYAVTTVAPFMCIAAFL
jgi:hypothetical protein